MNGFLLETHEGVQDMACDTFIKIALKCRRHFVTVQVGEAMPFIEEILSTISSIICDLQTQQVIFNYKEIIIRSNIPMCNTYNNIFTTGAYIL